MFQDISAERAVLASIYKYGCDSFIDVEDLLNVESFTLDAHQILWKIFAAALKDKTEMKLDIGTILSGSAQQGMPDYFEKPSESKIVRGIMNMSVEKENTRAMAKQIRKLQIVRGISETFDKTKEKLRILTGNETIGEIIGTSESALSEYLSTLNESCQMGPESIGKGLDKFYDHLLSKKGDVGISSGFKLWDDAIGGGFRRRTINLVGARTKVGKTIFADNVGLFVSGNLGVPVLNLDTEMSKEDHWTRMLANLSLITIREIETGEFRQNPDMEAKLKMAIETLSSMPYDYISIAGQAFEETLATMKRWITKSVGYNPDGTAKPCLIIYDYLKLMNSSSISKTMAEHQVLGFQMSHLHDFMNKNATPCLSFVQLNRDGVNDEDSTVISQSDRIAWLCSNFSIYKPKTRDEIAEEKKLVDKNTCYNRKLIPLFARHGGGLDDGDYINMSQKGCYALIAEGPTKNELHEGEETGESNEVEF